MTLSDKQNEFAKSLVRLLTWTEINGYKVSIGEVYRPEWVAKEYAARHSGIVNSLHTKKLAVDLNLFFNDVLLTTWEDYRLAGEFWESLSTPDLKHCWGGYFGVPDSDHFSIEHEGIR